MISTTQKPLISVCILTYNHQSYIKQAIESALMQDHPYLWEIIVADDCSTDKTTDIIKEYQAKFPELVRAITRPKNVGAYNNWKDLISSAKGKYIAFFEGDDFWTDCYKLKEQVLFMENNPSYSGCFHNCEVRSEIGENPVSSFLMNSYTHACDVTFKEMSVKNLIATSSLLYKSEIIQNNIPEWFSLTPMLDWPINLLLCRSGPLRYMPKCMSVYRRHLNGAWTGHSEEVQNEKTLLGYSIMIDNFQNEYKEYLIQGKNEFSELVQKKKKKKITIPRILRFLARKIESWSENKKPND